LRTTTFDKYFCIYKLALPVHDDAGAPLYETSALPLSVQELFYNVG